MFGEYFFVEFLDTIPYLHNLDSQGGPLGTPVPLDREGVTYGPRATSVYFIALNWHDLNMACETKIKTQCGPRTKIVVHPCARAYVKMVLPAANTKSIYQKIGEPHRSTQVVENVS